ncbi:MAG: hypothetical protein J5635_01435 [Paludibacteraceae bacterium]|nr:hypothetical protein [Paludibacteraceae bacterium]
MIDIRIKIADEQDLYNPFSTNDELSDDVKSYIAAQLEKITHPDAIRFTIVAPEPLDMERLDRARMRWNADLQESIKREKKKNRIRQWWFVGIGALFIVADLLLQDYLNTILEVALSTFGAFCLEEVAYIWIVENPLLRMHKTILSHLAKTEKIEAVVENN